MTTIKILRQISQFGKIDKIKRVIIDRIRRHYCRTYNLNELNNRVRILKKGIDKNFHLRKPPLVSIIITTYNQLSILKQAIESITKFTEYPNYELIIVDDCSTEKGMKEYLLSLKRGFGNPCRIFFNKRNMGFAKSNNKAIKNSKGDYVCLFNSDLIATDYWLSELVRTILSDKKIKIVGSKLLYPWNNKIQHAGVSFTKCGWNEVKDKDYFLPYNIYQGREMDLAESMQKKEYPAMGFSCALIEKKAIVKIGLLPIGYEFGGYDDIETCMLMRERGYKFFFCPTSILFHYETLIMTQHRDYRKNERRKAIYFMEKWSNKVNKLFSKDICILQNSYLNNKEFQEKKEDLSIIISF
ncbi:glycosyltransferase [Candidatus Pacearchaeota archaeon]|nr:glycosyltransferase [Candidatus Pacearchaeota archaeon]